MRERKEGFGLYILSSENVECVLVVSLEAW
jgi:hypothetical protein